MFDSAVITSLQNPKVKAVVDLHQRKYRDKRGLILIEGQHPIEEALHAGAELQEIYIRQGEALSFAVSCPVIEVTEAVMAKLSTTDSPAPILAMAKRPQAVETDVFQADNAFVLGLVGLQDPGNMGTLIRSACAFGITAVLTVGSSVDPYSPKVIRASAGLVFRPPIIQQESFEALYLMVAESPDLIILGADAHQGASYHATNYGKKCLLLMGSEAHGLPEDTWQIATPLYIPMASGVESLNVGVAGAIILAEAYQQRLATHLIQ